MTQTPRSVLIVGLGNADRADDGIGPLIVEKLRALLPAGVATASLGADPIALLAQWKGFDAAICIDAASPIGEPGRIHRFDLSTASLPSDLQPVSNHALDLAAAIRLAQVLREAPRDIIVYAVEGASFVAGAPMTAQVAMQAPRAAAQIAAEVERLRQDGVGQAAGENAQRNFPAA